MFDTNAECRECGFSTRIPVHIVNPGSRDGPLGQCPKCGAILHVARKTLMSSKLQIILMFIAAIIMIWVALK